jgi:hypothetical protein
VIHVYGIVEELDSLPPLAGVEDAPLERKRVGSLELVVSDVEADEVTQDAVLRHAEVVEELMSRSSAVLPAQFSRPFAAEDELAEAVSAKAPELEERLSEVRGCVELGVRAIAARASSSPKAGTGAEYMRARLAEDRQRRELMEKLDRPLAGLSHASARGTSTGSVFESAYLVPASKVAAFREAVRELESAHPELAIACTGPWPPYSFGAKAGA